MYTVTIFHTDTDSKTSTHLKLRDAIHLYIEAIKNPAVKFAYLAKVIESHPFRD